MLNFTYVRLLNVGLWLHIVPCVGVNIALIHPIERKLCRVLVIITLKVIIELVWRHISLRFVISLLLILHVVIEGVVIVGGNPWVIKGKLWLRKLS